MIDVTSWNFYRRAQELSFRMPTKLVRPGFKDPVPKIKNLAEMGPGFLMVRVVEGRRIDE